MTRTARFFIAAILVFAPFSSASAMDFALFGSYFDSDEFDSSLGLGLKADFELGGSPWSIEFRGSYFFELGADLQDFIEDTDPLVFEISALPLDLGVTYALGANESFIIGGGLSYVFLDSDRRELRIDDEAGWYAVLGYEGGQPDGGVGFFAEVLYRGIEATVEGDLDDLTVIEIDGKMDGFTANVGIIFRR